MQEAIEEAGLARSDLEKLWSLFTSVDGSILRLFDVLDQLRNWSEYQYILDSLEAMRDRSANMVVRLPKISQQEVQELRDIVDNIKVTARIEIPKFAIELHGQKRDAGAVIEEECSRLQNRLSAIRIGLFNISEHDIDDLVPEQKPAAYQFEFQNGVLVVKPHVSPVAGLEEQLALAAAAVLARQGDSISIDLLNSNCPPRLVAAFNDLHEELKSSKNIIALGMLNQSFSYLINGSVEELSSTLYERLRSHASNVFDYAAQFPEWRMFLDNAISTRLTQAEIKDLADMARELAGRLAGGSEAVAASVPRALREVADTLELEARPSPQKTLNLARTLENLLSAVVKYAAAVGKEMLSQMKKNAATVVLGFVAGVAWRVLDKVPGAEWVSSVMPNILDKIFGN